MSSFCVTDNGDEGRRALPGLRLCPGCRDHLERDIAALPGLYADLERVLATTGQAGQRVSGSSSEPLPINPAVADHRHQIAHDLTMWCVFVAEARGHTLPVDHITDRLGKTRAAFTPPTITAPWLVAHVDWLAAQPDTAEECPGVMRDLAGRARALIQPSGARRIEIGPCCESGEGGVCPGTLWATVRAEDDVRASVIYCGVCEFEKPPSEWMRFGREYQRQQAS